MNRKLLKIVSIFQNIFGPVPCTLKTNQSLLFLMRSGVTLLPKNCFWLPVAALTRIEKTRVSSDGHFCDVTISAENSKDIVLVHIPMTHMRELLRYFEENNVDCAEGPEDDEQRSKKLATAVPDDDEDDGESSEDSTSESDGDSGEDE